MKTRSKILVATSVVALMAIVFLAYVNFLPGWSQARVGIHNIARWEEHENENGPCWRVWHVKPRQLHRGGWQQNVILEREDVYWEDVEVLQMPQRARIEHGKAGLVKVDDAVCTTSHSQVWIHEPTGEELSAYCYIPEWPDCIGHVVD